MTKSDSAWLAYSYLALVLVVAYVFYQAIYTLGVYTMWVERYDQFYPAFSGIASATFGVLAVFAYARNEARREYHLSVIAEVRKVRWPSFENTKKMTLIVAVVVAIFSVILFVFDSIWLLVLKMFLPS